MCFIKKIKEGDNRKLLVFNKVIFEYKKKHSKRFYIEQCQKLRNQLDYMKKHCDIKQMKPADGELRAYQLALVNFAKVFFDEIKGLNIKPFLVCGNLLGYIRHNGFIPWDDDLDFGLFREDYEKLITYCQEHYNVCYYDGKLSEYNGEMVWKRIENLCNQYPDKYVLTIFSDQLQLSRGTSIEDNLFIDFWCFDFYDDNYSFEKHSKYIEVLRKKQKDIDRIDNIAKFLREEAHSNPNIVKCSSKIYFSPDSRLSYDNINNKFIDKDIILPLKRANFEGASFFIPNDPEKYIYYEFKDYMQYPQDICFNHHNYYRGLYLNSKRNEE